MYSWTLSELRYLVKEHENAERWNKSDPLRDMNKWKKSNLEAACQELRLKLAPQATVNKMRLTLRNFYDQTKVCETKVKFGKFRELSYKELMRDRSEYAEWVVNEYLLGDKRGHSIHLVRFAWFVLRNRCPTDEAKERLNTQRPIPPLSVTHSRAHRCMAEKRFENEKNKYKTNNRWG